eukprot:CAMPEP_0172867552 /NCGR_PEP_ID=MMETSP1075-20121228/83962_1 /TAXON_ID=2916 /ORGANISM="Ceratium fusus, Strain PA161109" /LENGTH=55 /DNA_ID=CAMNT_0013716943 /DNA_START=21 /DNA_END=185 /DNA_ORIENTATION=-
MAGAVSGPRIACDAASSLVGASPQDLHAWSGKDANEIMVKDAASTHPVHQVGGIG